MHACCILAMMGALVLVPAAAHAANPNLFVSAENPEFEDHFAGSMIIEVVINDNTIKGTGPGSGEPDVTLNGRSLRMVQATDGNWYAYFTNLQKAKAADSTVGLEGTGLDFGVFCSSDTAESVLGISLSDAEGFAVPRHDGLGNFTNGQDAFLPCTGSVENSKNINNVLRGAKSINTRPELAGQIGLDADAWPLVQLFSFGDVEIQYNLGGPAQKVSLKYDEIPNISTSMDRQTYPENSQVFLSIKDMQLNQDPTDEDSWTFSSSPPAVFYRAFDGDGPADISPRLSLLGFEDNGQLLVDLGAVLELRPNRQQPHTGIDGFPSVITLAETRPNSGIFDNADNTGQSNLVVRQGAPRGQAGSVTYDGRSYSILTGSSSATITLGPSLSIDNTQLTPGREFKVTLVDPDQNISSGARDHLDVFRATAQVPAMQMGSPVTLLHAHDIRIHLDHDDGTLVDSAVPDEISARLYIGTPGDFGQISMNLGITAAQLASSLIKPAQDRGTNWLNYDLRSLGITDLSDASIKLSFGRPDSMPVYIINPGDLAGPRGFILLDDSAIKEIHSRTGDVFVVIDFFSKGAGSLGAGPGMHPIILDLFSFGMTGTESVINAMYRFELEETGKNTSEFEGTIEYAIANQLNIFDPEFIRTVSTISDEIKFITFDRLDDGISIKYPDLGGSGVPVLESSQSGIRTSSGIVTVDSGSYRFGQPVTVTVSDPDLNLRGDIIDIYTVINDPGSPYVDAVGRGDAILLEILIKGLRYQRCTVNGAEFGGLGSTGFGLAETGPGTGVFEGVFKMPSQICNKQGTGLVSSAGGSVDARYYDARDDSGNPNTSEISFDLAAEAVLDYAVARPFSGTKEIRISGILENHKKGVPLAVHVMHPDKSTEIFTALIFGNGSYSHAIQIDRNYPVGIHTARMTHLDAEIDEFAFHVKPAEPPAWLKEGAGRWSAGQMPDFADEIRFLIDEDFVEGPSGRAAAPYIPDWLKNTARWWSADQITDGEFLACIWYLVKNDVIRA